MHNFRLRWVALGLLIYVQGAICRSTPTLCPSFDPVIRFDDVPSRIVNASVIIEAVVNRTKSVPEMPGRVLVYFRFERIVKGDLKSYIGRDVTTSGRTKNSSPLSFTTVVAKYSGSVAKQEEGSAQDCPTPQPPVLPKIRKNEPYFIFVDLPEELQLNGDESLHNLVELTSNTSVGLARHILPMSGFPLLATNSVRTDVQRFINCSKCKRLPRVRLQPAEKTEVAGQKVTLHCRASGKPRIVVTWYKDGQQIVTNSSRITIKTNKRGSQLEIRRTRPEDTGKYGCQAATVMALSSLQWSDVVITSEDEPTTSSPTTHTAPCSRAHKGYCFNGGTCRKLTKMDKIICQCRGDFEGERCQERRNGLAALGKRRRSARHSHHHHPVPPASWLTSSTSGDRDLQQDDLEDTRQRVDEGRSESTLSTSGSSQKLTGDHLLLTAISSSASSSSSSSSSSLSSSSSSS